MFAGDGQIERNPRSPRGIAASTEIGCAQQGSEIKIDNNHSRQRKSKSPIDARKGNWRARLTIVRLPKERIASSPHRVTLRKCWTSELAAEERIDTNGLNGCRSEERNQAFEGEESSFATQSGIGGSCLVCGNATRRIPDQESSPKADHFRFSDSFLKSVLPI
jgi:hypothetical protein